MHWSRVLVLHVDWDAFKKRKVSPETFALTLFWQRQPLFPQETSLTMGTSQTQRERSGGCSYCKIFIPDFFFFWRSCFFLQCSNQDIKIVCVHVDDAEKLCWSKYLCVPLGGRTLQQVVNHGAANAPLGTMLHRLFYSKWDKILCTHGFIREGF